MKSNIPKSALCLFVLAVLFLPVGVFASDGDTLPERKALSSLDIAILGDSNAQIGGDDCTGEKGWNTWFRIYSGCHSCHSYARSGATWTNAHRTVRNTTENISVIGDNNVIYNQVCRLIDAVACGEHPKPDAVIVACGTNDAWFRRLRPALFESLPIGEEILGGSASPSSAVTLTQSVTLSCAMLRKAFPGVCILLVTPPETVKASPAIINKVGNIISSYAEENGCALIRLDKDGPVRAANEKNHFHYTYDGTHTSKDGAQIHGRLIAEALCACFADSKE